MLGNLVLSCTCICLVLIKCYVFHLASYGAGLLGSLMYMRMLGNSVDSLRTDGPKALIKYDFRDAIFS